MDNKHCFDALDRTLRDILQQDRPFRGITIALGGDFRQILPMVPKRIRVDIVQATITSSYLWKNFKVHTINSEMKHLIIDFYKWLLSIGNGYIH